MKSLRPEAEIIKGWSGDLHNPLVSISCLTYNHEDFIEDALSGFLSQETSFSFEILVHDDASTDNTAKVIRRLEKEYPNIIKPVYQKINQWSINREGIRKAQYNRMRGKYVAFCEGDDFWTDPRKLQKQVDFLENNPEYSMCFHPVKQIFVGEDTELNRLSILNENEFKTDDIWNSWIIQQSTILIKKSILLDDYYVNNISKKKMYFGDLFLILCAAEEGKIYGFNEAMSVYRKHPGSITAKGSNPSLDQMVRMLKYISLIGALFNKKYKEQSKYYYTFKAFRYAYVCKERKLYLKSLDFLLKAFFKSPKKFLQLYKGETASKKV